MKIISIFLSVIIFWGYYIPVQAAENLTNQEIIENIYNIESFQYDQDGNPVISTVNIGNEPKVYSKVACKENVLMKQGMKNTETTTTIYTSSLGPADQWRWVWAQSAVNNDAIDYMWISCSGYYVGGNLIDTVYEETPSGWTSKILSAIVKVPENPFEFEVGSGVSQHVYNDHRYYPINHNLYWGRS